MKLHTEETLFKCQVCGRGFPTSIQLKTHENEHAVDDDEDLLTLFKCVVCGETFKTSRDCTNHIQLHSIEDNHEHHQDDLATVDQENNVHTHAEIEEVETDEDEEVDEEILYYSCDVCNKQFKLEADLRIHSRTHSIDKYKCDICDKRFSILSNFNVHKRRHETCEKPYRCEICGKSFRLAKSLTVHMVLHSENESFNCEICHRTFGRSGSLKMHMKSHTSLEQQRAYIDICNDDEDDDDVDEIDGDIVYDLVDERPTYCDICGQKFTRSNGNLRTHKCNKYAIENTLNSHIEHAPAIDIWNCK